MAQVNYYVIRQAGEWKIKCLDQHFGPYKSQKDAIKQAIDVAQKAGEKGYGAQVHIQGVDNKFRLEWTYGKDAAPSG